MRIGLVGIGSIGLFLAKKLPGPIIATDMDLHGAQKRLDAAGLGRVTLVPEMNDPLFLQTDFVVEAASQEAVAGLAPVLSHADVLVMSVGAFTDNALWEQLKAEAEKSGHRIFIPSGAIGGLDVLQSCRPSSVTLETRKNPKSLGRADTAETVVFDGPAREACRLYPKNVNVAATLSLAGVGFDKTRVRVVSDPGAEKNTHTVSITGETGDYRFVFENHAFAENPKTSALAAHSALWAITRQSKRIRVG